jgi:sulfur carrier protein
MIVVVLNGERRELPDGATLAAAVRDAGVIQTGRGVAVALDGEVVPRGEWARTEVCQGQQVDVVHAVQGG